MSLVNVTVRQRDGMILWQQMMDQDSAYFKDFWYSAEADLVQGCSITITPEEEKLETRQVSRTRWDGLKR